MKKVLFAVAALFSAGAVASDASDSYVNALHKAVAPCQVARFKMNIEGAPSAADIASWGECMKAARTDGSEVYKSYISSTKTDAVRQSAKAVFSAWLSYLDVTTDGSSDADQNSLEALALRKAESDLEAEAMAE